MIEKRVVQAQVLDFTLFAGSQYVSYPSIVAGETPVFVFMGASSLPEDGGRKNVAFILESKGYEGYIANEQEQFYLDFHYQVGQERWTFRHCQVWIK